MNAVAEYWIDAVCEVLDEHGVKATPEQAKLIARDLESIRDGIFESSYHPRDPMLTEVARVTSELRKEQAKVGCPDCGGSGRLKYNAGPWGCNTECGKCHGHGKYTP